MLPIQIGPLFVRLRDALQPLLRQWYASSTQNVRAQPLLLNDEVLMTMTNNRELTNKDKMFLLLLHQPYGVAVEAHTITTMGTLYPLWAAHVNTLLWQQRMRMTHLVDAMFPLILPTMDDRSFCIEYDENADNAGTFHDRYRYFMTQQCPWPLLVARNRLAIVAWLKNPSRYYCFELAIDLQRVAPLTEVNQILLEDEVREDLPSGTVTLFATTLEVASNNRRYLWVTLPLREMVLYVQNRLNTLADEMDQSHQTATLTRLDLPHGRARWQSSIFPYTLQQHFLSSKHLNVAEMPTATIHIYYNLRGIAYDIVYHQTLWNYAKVLSWASLLQAAQQAPTNPHLLRRWPTRFTSEDSTQRDSYLCVHPELCKNLYTQVIQANMEHVDFGIVNVSVASSRDLVVDSSTRSVYYVAIITFRPRRANGAIHLQSRFEAVLSKTRNRAPINNENICFTFGLTFELTDVVSNDHRYELHVKNQAHSSHPHFLFASCSDYHEPSLCMTLQSMAFLFHEPTRAIRNDRVGVVYERNVTLLQLSHSLVRTLLSSHTDTVEIEPSPSLDTMMNVVQFSHLPRTTRTTGSYERLQWQMIDGRVMVFTALRIPSQSQRLDEISVYAAWIDFDGQAWRMGSEPQQHGRIVLIARYNSSSIYDVLDEDAIDACYKDGHFVVLQRSQPNRFTTMESQVMGDAEDGQTRISLVFSALSEESYTIEEKREEQRRLGYV